MVLRNLGHFKAELASLCIATDFFLIIFITSAQLQNIHYCHKLFKNVFELMHESNLVWYKSFMHIF